MPPFPLPHIAAAANGTAAADTTTTPATTTPHATDDAASRAPEKADAVAVPSMETVTFKEACAELAAFTGTIQQWKAVEAEWRYRHRVMLRADAELRNKQEDERQIARKALRDRLRNPSKSRERAERRKKSKILYEQQHGPLSLSPLDAARRKGQAAVVQWLTGNGG